MVYNRGYPLSTYAKFSKKNNISNPLIRTRTCTCQGVRNASFSGNFAYVLNGRPCNYFQSRNIHKQKLYALEDFKT